MARPKKSAEVLKIQGTYRKDRHQERPSGKAPGVPEPSTELDGDARKFWDLYVAALIAGGAVGAVDSPALTSLAIAYQDWMKLSRLSRKMKPGEDGYAGILRLAIAARESFERAADKFGLTPSARVKLGKAAKETSGDDRESKFFGSAG